MRYDSCTDDMHVNFYPFIFVLLTTSPKTLEMSRNLEPNEEGARRIRWTVRKWWERFPAPASNLTYSQPAYIACKADSF